jgi:hypothetical protein
MTTTCLLGWISVVGAGLVALAPLAQADDSVFLTVMHGQYFARSHGGGGHLPGPWWVGVLLLIVVALVARWYRWKTRR